MPPNTHAVPRTFHVRSVASFAGGDRGLHGDSVPLHLRRNDALAAAVRAVETSTGTRREELMQNRRLSRDFVEVVGGIFWLARCSWSPTVQDHLFSRGGNMHLNTQRRGEEVELEPFLKPDRLGSCINCLGDFAGILPCQGNLASPKLTPLLPNHSLRAPSAPDDLPCPSATAQRAATGLPVINPTDV